MTILNDDRKWCHKLEHHSRVNNYAPVTVIYAPIAVNYAPIAVNYAPIAINHAPRDITYTSREHLWYRHHSWWS